MKKISIVIISISFLVIFHVPVQSDTFNPTIWKTQLRLKELGYQINIVSGEKDQKTESAIINFQKDQNIPVTGSIDQITLHELSNTYKVYTGICKQEPPYVQIRAFFTPDFSNKYTVLDRYGKTLFDGRIQNKKYDDAVEGLIIGTFVTPTDSSVDLNSTPKKWQPYIVVKNNDNVIYKGLAIEKVKISDDKLLKYIRAKQIKVDNKQIESGDLFRKEVYFAGRHQNKTRILILAWNPHGKDSKGIVSIAELVKNELKELYTYKKVSGHDNYVTLRFQGMADYNQDGLADIFFISYEDFGGEDIFIEKETKWIKQYYYEPSP